jgi:hypothetical protein
MLIVISKEELQALLQQEIKGWESIGGGPNLNAFYYDEKATDPQTLKTLGYYDNRDAWVAGTRIRAIQSFLKDLEARPQFTGK